MATAKLMLYPFLRKATLASLVLLGACASKPSQPPQEAPPSDTNAAVAEPVFVERAFPDDSLHDVLLAEFALRRREYNVALDAYMSQAPVLQDAGVAAHTTRLAQFLDRRDESLQAALLWVSLEPDNNEARTAAMRQLILDGRNIEALPHLEAIEASGEPANFIAVTSQFDQLPPADQLAMTNEINLLIDKYPTNTSLLLTSALIENTQRNADGALQSLDALLELEPQHAQALLLEASILSDQGATKPFARIEKTLADNPENQSLRMSYARLLTRTNLDAARTQFEILSAAAPQDVDLLFSLALINRETGDQQAASEYLQKMVELGERTDEAHYYLGRTEQDNGDLEKALHHYQLVGDGDEFMAATSRIGEILLDSNQAVRFLAWFEDQRGHYPERNDQLYGLQAELLSKAGETELAMKLLNEGLTTSPEEANLLYARAMLLEGQDDLAGMEKDLRDILSREPDNATALNALGYTLANRTNRYEEALALVSRAMELQPGEPAILDSMGWVLFRLQRYEEALDYLTRAYAEFPDAEVAAHLGEVMWAMGDAQGALSIWRAASMRDPDHPVLKSTLERLEIGELKPVSLEERYAE